MRCGLGTGSRDYNVVEKTRDGKRADAAFLGGDGGEVGAGANFFGDVTLYNAFFGGSASID